jgi:hypothetical protein
MLLGRVAKQGREVLLSHSIGCCDIAGCAHVCSAREQLHVQHVERRVGSKLHCAPSAGGW